MVYGNAEQSQRDAIYLARHIGLRCGIPTEVPALIVSRICGSGLQAIVTGVNTIMLGEAEYVLAGGCENMTQTPYVLWGARTGWGLGTGKMEDYLWEAFAPQYFACEKHLEIERNKCNVNGGAIAIGHPLGASGVRVALTLMYELRRRGKKYGVSSLCIGGGMGIAAVWENLQL